MEPSEVEPARAPVAASAASSLLPSPLTSLSPSRGRVAFLQVACQTGVIPPTGS
eukprot:CAMPEP_0171067080 /NCGR_PEP_ID=MMETSP0766_2-20121228/7795_1 /TAXON_ID=439317 /ORGANISM="Gambierdiscus australes, Strain CAWD 149" /LENGTH=53 /DNA_ID=CAMNT_0011523295 /DNA_START=13 /DNA_END=174 /DNA_ORIENTATION=-